MAAKAVLLVQQIIDAKREKDDNDVRRHIDHFDGSSYHRPIRLILCKVVAGKDLKCHINGADNIDGSRDDDERTVSAHQQQQ
eukprot:CAMPEP_0197079594 /NCGR_PEP_ID=MMETSP1384-20130603/213707_2 /TAXON_ID=29189 /ORGANISM="Ammonia sp." /LENGTH=81 /DNA_ID=CAMNT_0042518471 /DNA_START=187 /DNA_END=432 /DNA_ORIENTATION=-